MMSEKLDISNFLLYELNENISPCELIKLAILDPDFQ
jgi:hypothetical protein